jgi:hypothetical protein
VLRGRVLSNPGSLPALLLVNSFDGGANGVTILPGVSGGASGNAFDAVSIGASATLVFSNTTYASGSLSAQFTTPGTATFNDLQWSNDSVGNQQKIWFRVCCFFSANPANNMILFRALTDNTVLVCASLELNTSGNIIVNNTTSSVVLTSARKIPLNQWFRIEGYFTAPSLGGKVSFSLFSTPVAQVPVETQATATSTAGPINIVRFGVIANTANLSFYLDSVGISNIGYLGPVSFPGQASSGMPGTAIQPRPQAVPRGRVIQGQVLESSFTPPAPSPVYPQNSPVRAHAVLPQRGRCFSSLVAKQQVTPHVGPPVYPQRTAVRCKITAVPKGRVYSDFGGAVANPVIRSVRVKTGSLYQNWDSGGIYTNWTAGAPTT